MDRGVTRVQIVDTYESDFLEPWCQWVSVHTGMSTAEHGVKHLGQIQGNKCTQVWDEEKNRGKFGVVWGCLNSSTPVDSDILYFPDPWTKSSAPTRWYLKPIINFLRFAVSRRSNEGLGRTMIDYINLLPALAFTIAVCSVMIDRAVLSLILKYRFKALDKSMLYAIVEYLLARFAIKLRARKGKTDILFLNMIAHAQHYYWNTPKHYIVDTAFFLSNALVDNASKVYDDLLILNGLTQEYSGENETWHSWIPKGGWAYFAKVTLGIDATVEPCMSYDCNLFFETQAKRDRGLSRLRECRLPAEDSSLFLLEVNPNNHLNVFCRLLYYGFPNASVLLGSERRVIEELFDLAAVRTGRHCQYAIVIGARDKLGQVNADYRALTGLYV